jgi:Spy/CpxP family protein refolding chaperone
MKRLTLSVVMTGVLALAAFSLSNAQQGGETPRGRGPGAPGGPGGFGRGGVAVLRGVDLNDEQKASIKAVLEAERSARTGAPADMGLRRELEAELFADSPDAQKIVTLQQQLVQAQGERLAREIAVQQKVAAVLTAEQRAQVRERLSQAPPERRGGLERRGADDRPADHR